MTSGDIASLAILLILLLDEAELDLGLLELFSSTKVNSFEVEQVSKLLMLSVDFFVDYCTSSFLTFN